MMLRCERCGKGVRLLTPAESEQVRERPSAYTYLCVECRGEVVEDGDPYADAGD